MRIEFKTITPYTQEKRKTEYRISDNGFVSFGNVKTRKIVERKSTRTIDSFGLKFRNVGKQ